MKDYPAFYFGVLKKMIYSTSIYIQYLSTYWIDKFFLYQTNNQNESSYILTKVGFPTIRECNFIHNHIWVQIFSLNSKENFYFKY